MHKTKLSDFEITVLDESEKNEAIDSIRKLILGRANSLEKKYIKIPNEHIGGKIDGLDFFNMAQHFEYDIHKFPLNKQMPMVARYTSMMNEIIGLDNFFEYSYLTGKIYLHGTRDTEDFICQNKTPDNELKKSVLENHIKARDNFNKSLKLFKETNTNALLRFYETTMEMDLAISYKREAFFRSLSAKSPAQVIQANNALEDLVILAQAANGIYTRLLNKSLFLDQQQAARTLYNLANVMKLGKVQEYKKALSYCHTAKEILGELPEIKEAIGYFEDILKFKKE